MDLLLKNLSKIYFFQWSLEVLQQINLLGPKNIPSIDRDTKINTFKIVTWNTIYLFKTFHWRSLQKLWWTENTFFYLCVAVSLLIPIGCVQMYLKANTLHNRSDDPNRSCELQRRYRKTLRYLLEGTINAEVNNIFNVFARLATSQKWMVRRLGLWAFGCTTWWRLIPPGGWPVVAPSHSLVSLHRPSRMREVWWGSTGGPRNSSDPCGAVFSWTYAAGSRGADAGT